MNATASPSPNGSTPATRIIADTLFYQLAGCAATADPINLSTADYNACNGRVGDTTPSLDVVPNKRNASPHNVSTANSHASTRHLVIVVAAAATAAAIINNIVGPPAIRQSNSSLLSVLASVFKPKQHNRRRGHTTGLQCLDWSQRPRF